MAAEPATGRQRLIALRMFFDYLAYVCEQQIINPVVAQRHYVDKGPRGIRQEDLEKLFVSIGDHQRDRAIFTLMLDTGLRVGVVVNLHLADVFLHENRRPHLRANGKGQHERVVYLSATAAQLLSEYLRARPAESGEQVFQNRRGKPNTVCRTSFQPVEEVPITPLVGQSSLGMKQASPMWNYSFCRDCNLQVTKPYPLSSV